jgi:hypothetical protein
MKTELDFTATKSHPRKINSPRCPFIYDDFKHMWNMRNLKFVLTVYGI